MTDAGSPPRGSVEVARLGRSHGLEGVVRVHPHDDASREALAAAGRVWVDGLGDAEVLGLKRHGPHLLLRLDRLRRVELAKALVHAAVHVDRGLLPDAIAAALGRDATGLPVLVDGRPYGRVRAVEGSEAAPLLRVDGPHGERLVPLAAEYVQRTDDAVIVTDPPPGLLEDDA